jgi:SpoVK/Ycf46/Vps4 family AAA+-type ATPase
MGCSYVGADLAAVCREAGMLALRRNAESIENADFEAAVRTVVPSGNRRDQVCILVKGVERQLMKGVGVCGGSDLGLNWRTG